VVNADLHAVVGITTMARALAGYGQLDPDTAFEIVAAYERVRQDARALNVRAWPDDGSFDRDVPALTATASVRRLPHTMSSAQASVDAVAAGSRAVVLAAQLASWAEGHQEAFEIEARLTAAAEAKAKTDAAATQPPLGFHDSSPT
jgi:hypothetical protein